MKSNNHNATKKSTVELITPNDQARASFPHILKELKKEYAELIERNANEKKYFIDCYKKDISEIDEEYYKSSWMSKNELIDKYGQFDQWSKFIIDDMVDNDL